METRNSCTVISFVPFPIREEKPGLIPPRYFIAESDTKTPQTLVVGPAMHYVYLDESRGNLQVRDSPEEVARSIVEDYSSAQLEVADDSGPAIFWIPGVAPINQILSENAGKVTELLNKQRNWFVRICRVADNDWNKYHQHNVVSDFQRKVAVLIGLNPDEHEWMLPKQAPPEIPMKPCISCGSQIGMNVAVCPICRAILDEKKFAAIKFA